MIKTKNFAPESDKKLLCTCNKVGCDKRSVNQESLNMVQIVRNLANRPLIINSGGRCPLHDDEVNKSKPADHQKCIGVDVRVHNDDERIQIVILGLMAGFTAIGVGKGFVHLGNRGGKDLAYWRYSYDGGNVLMIMDMLKSMNLVNLK